jgi:antibiotic biosynthesis monooxygenase (ABM) superfamily enzyme
MVIYVMRYNIRPSKAEAYEAWVMPATRRCIAVPGVAELRAYRAIAGPAQVMAMWEFTDLATWAAWYAHEDVRKTVDEQRAFISDLEVELWGSSPVAPEPMRPGQ